VAPLRFCREVTVVSLTLTNERWISVAARRRSSPASQIPRASDAWLSPVSYWQPTHYAYSAWFGHAPFASWLTDKHRPRTVVELGSHNGFSYFNFCETSTRLGLNNRLWAIDSWEGDDHAGFYDGSVYKLVSDVNTRYEDRSTLLRGYFSAMAPDIENDSVDLLHIDGRHGYDDVREDYELYLPKLSTRGIVLFHDVVVRKDDFGVYRFWDELKERYPSFTFEHSSGLGVLFVGKSSADAFREFLASAKQHADDIRADYSALGDRIEDRYTVQNEGYHARLQLDTILRSKSYRLTVGARAIRAKLPR
jgi:hypothetical protein